MCRIIMFIVEYVKLSEIPFQIVFQSICSCHALYHALHMWILTNKFPHAGIMKNSNFRLKDSAKYRRRHSYQCGCTHFGCRSARI